MVIVATNSDYIKSQPENAGLDLDKYFRYLQSEGKTQGGMQRTRSNLDIFFRYAPTAEPSAEQFRTAMAGLESHGYSRKLIHEILSNAGRMYQYFYGMNPWNLIRPQRRVKWYEVPEAPYPFDEVMERFSQFLDSEPMNDEFRSRRIYHAEKALRILCHEKGIGSAYDIDCECFAIIERYVRHSSQNLRRTVMFNLGQFVLFATGKDVYREYRARKNRKSDFEFSPQWEHFIETAEKYLADCRERGFTDLSVRHLRTNIVTTLRRLFGFFGPLDPSEVTYHHFRQFRSMSTDIKDTTIKHDLGNLGRLLEYATGTNPTRSARMVWSKQGADRTWVFRDQWKRIFQSASNAERVALVLCAGMGLRRNEVATLKLSDIVGNIMTIRGKGHGSGKTVEKEIPRSVISVIQAYLPEREILIKKYGDRYGGTLLVPPFYSNGQLTLNRYVGNLILEASARVGIHATCHTFRRFYCMNLLDNGFELDTVRRMMRHSSVEVTLESYVYADPRKIKSATDSVDDTLFG